MALLPLVVGCDLDLKAARKALDPKVKARVQELETRMASTGPSAGTAADLGEAYLEGGALFEAADAFRRAAELGDKGDRVEAGLAAAYLGLGYVKSAIEHLTACFRLNRDNPSCLLTLAGLMESDGRKDALLEARRAYQRFLDLAPNHPRAAYARSMLEQLNASLGPESVGPESAEAPEVGRGASMTDPHPTPPRGHPPTAQHPGPSGSAVRPSKGTAPTASGHEPGAPPTIAGHAHGVEGQEVGELKPFGLAIQKAMEAERAENHRGAIAAYREALTLEPNDPTALAGLARSLWRAEQTKEALDVAEAAYRQAPTDPEVRYVFGLIMLKSGRNPEIGLSAWKALARDDPEYAARLGLPASIEQLERFRSDGAAPASKGHDATDASRGASAAPTPH
ncbi:MAG: tetratricopeptide repeat protein [Deltaproteobacteria bacterium]|nr:tetratricopeptide repeat protein [Deltaproteobacteria bacterium]